MSTQQSFDYLTNRLKSPVSPNNSSSEDSYQKGIMIARTYCSLENSIAVLSDMVRDRSFICYGQLGGQTALDCTGEEEVSSIWEQKILNLIHEDDQLEKCAWELRFLTFLESVPLEEKRNYMLQHPVRMRMAGGEYQYMQHRVMYLDYDGNGHVQLALCLYNSRSTNDFVTGIVNTLTGKREILNGTMISNILSEREKEVLQLIGKGLSSKMIAETLSISVHTVNGHRQNLMQKLHVANSSEAYSVAMKLGIL